MVTSSGSAGKDQNDHSGYFANNGTSVGKKYLRKSFLHALSFLIGHFYDFTDLLDEGLPLTLQDELTLNLKQKAKDVQLL